MAVAYSRNKHTKLRNLNLKTQLSIFDIFRDICDHIYDFLKFVGGLWAWHFAEKNLRCPGICMPFSNEKQILQTTYNHLKIYVASISKYKHVFE